MISKPSDSNVFKDLGYAPEEAEKLMIKSKLMMAVESYIQENALTQSQAAEALGVSRSRISDALRRQLHKFTIDALIDMLACVGKHFSITISQDAA